jgi:hypothetical protein
MCCGQVIMACVKWMWKPKYGQIPAPSESSWFSAQNKFFIIKMLAALLWWCWLLQKIHFNVLLPNSNSMCEMTVKTLVLTNSGTFRIFMVFSSKLDFRRNEFRVLSKFSLSPFSRRGRLSCGCCTVHCRCAVVITMFELSKSIAVSRLALESGPSNSFSLSP